MIGPFLWWVVLRVWCAMVGHRWERTLVGSRHGLTRGYECERCGARRRSLARWQSVE